MPRGNVQRPQNQLSRPGACTDMGALFSAASQVSPRFTKPPPLSSPATTGAFNLPSKTKPAGMGAVCRSAPTFLPPGGTFCLHLCPLVLHYQTTTSPALCCNLKEIVFSGLFNCLTPSNQCVHVQSPNSPLLPLLHCMVHTPPPPTNSIGENIFSHEAMSDQVSRIPIVIHIGTHVCIVEAPGESTETCSCWEMAKSLNHDLKPLDGCPLWLLHCTWGFGICSFTGEEGVSGQCKPVTVVLVTFVLTWALTISLLTFF